MWTQRKLANKFKLRGFTLTTEALKALTSAISEEESKHLKPNGEFDNEGERSFGQECIDKVISIVSSSGTGATVVILAHVKAAVEMTKLLLSPGSGGSGAAGGGGGGVATCFTVISAKDIPQLCYDHVKKSYYTVMPGKPAPSTTALFSAVARTSGPQSLCFGDAASKLNLFKSRFELIKLRVLRNPSVFNSAESSLLMPRSSSSNSGNGGGASESRVPLTSIEALTGSVGTHTILGILDQENDGTWFLEDPDSKVPVDLTHAVFSQGLITQCGVYLARGSINNGTFVVSALGIPPIESREETLAALGSSLDYFGGGSGSGGDSSRNMAALTASVAQAKRKMDVEGEESEGEDDDEEGGPEIVILSDLWLDDAGVMKDFSELLASLEESGKAPEIMVLMGNFTSKPFGGGADQSAVTRLFEGLAATIERSSPLVARDTCFVVIPGPTDPCGSVGGPLPRPKIPTYFAGPLVRKFNTEKTTRVFLATSPCRLRYQDQELVLFRENIVNKMYRHSFLHEGNKVLTPPQLAEQFVRTVLSQGHLCPLPLSVEPVCWNLDHCLSLSPLPHLVAVGDISEGFVHRFEESDCICVNPGPFGRDRSFITYFINSHTAMMCAAC